MPHRLQAVVACRQIQLQPFLFHFVEQGLGFGKSAKSDKAFRDGKSRAVPEHFRLVTSDQGLTVQLTAVGDWLQLCVLEKTPERNVVREALGKNGKFDYLVQGVRKGYENHQVIRDRSEHPKLSLGNDNVK